MKTYYENKNQKSYIRYYKNMIKIYLNNVLYDQKIFIIAFYDKIITIRINLNTSLHSD